jgi:hypothetical protein
MRRVILIASIVFASFGTTTAQDAYINAIGLRGGPLAGVTYKHFVWPVNGVIEGIVGFNFLNDRTTSFTGLYEYHLFINYHLNVFGGGGTTLAFNSETFRWQAEAIIGAELLLDTLPLLFSIDWKPGWSILSNEFVFTEAALSVRYILRQ